MLPSGNDAALVLAENIGALLAFKEWKTNPEIIYDKFYLYVACK